MSIRGDAKTLVRAFFHLLFLIAERIWKWINKNRGNQTMKPLTPKQQACTHEFIKLYMIKYSRCVKCKAYRKEPTGELFA